MGQRGCVGMGEHTYRAGFTVYNETWYSKVIPRKAGYDHRAEITVGIYNETGGGCEYEIGIVWKRDPDLMFVRVWNDGLAAFTDPRMVGMFAALAQWRRDNPRKGEPDPAEIVEMLTALGFTDRTERVEARKVDRS